MTSNEEVSITSPEPTISPLPYYSTLCKTLGGATLALVVTYLEIHHPPANDATRTPAGPSSAPVFVGCDQMCAAIGVNRRTLLTSLYRIATFWRSEEARSAASRSGREFIEPSHILRTRIKPYSLVGSRQFVNHQTFTIRRNYGRINTILTSAHIDIWQQVDDSLAKYNLGQIDTSATTSSVLNLSEIMEKAVNLGLTNGWTVERKERQSKIMKGIWERRKKSVRANKVFGDIEL